MLTKEENYLWDRLENFFWKNSIADTLPVGWVGIVGVELNRLLRKDWYKALYDQYTRIRNI